MKNYELTYLVPSSLTEEEQKRASEEITSFIQDKGGALKESGMPVKKILPQKIKGQKEVFSVSVYFYIGPDKLREIQDALKMKKEIIRFMLVNKKALSVQRPIRKRIKKEPQTFGPSSGRRQKVELKDIEEKIEEILKG